MKWFLYLISVFFVSTGTWLILYTEQSRTVLKRMFAGVDVKLLAIAPIVIGVLLLFAAYESQAFLLICLLGLLALLKGLLFIFNPGKIVDNVMSWWFETSSEQAVRLWGLIAVVLGTAVLSWI